MTTLESWVWLSGLRPLRAAARRALLEHFEDARDVSLASAEELRRVPELTEAERQLLLDRNPENAAAILRRCEEKGVTILTLRDAAYPDRLRGIPDPPLVLYVLGRLPAVDAEAVVAAVGTRECSYYGEKMARQLGYEIAAVGGVVCTGLAGGIDSRCAEGALLAGGRVIGVLGTAIDEIYPKYNGALYADVLAEGAILSEYPPGTPTRRSFFPERNRIIAGLSVAAVVVEAPLRSGALITASLALDYGRDVYAVPGNADAPKSMGCNNLLREGAGLALDGWDVLKDYEARFPGRLHWELNGAIPAGLHQPEWTRRAEHAARRQRGERKKAETAVREEPEEEPVVFRRFRNSRRTDPAPAAEDAAGEDAAQGETMAQQLSALTASQLRIVGAMTGPDMHVDDIVEGCGLPVAEVLSELTMLQIKGYVTQAQGKRFTLKISGPA